MDKMIYDYSVCDEGLDIRLPEKLTSVDFFESFYELQIQLETQTFKRITIDLSECIWADVIALGTFLLMLNKAKDLYDPDIQFVLMSDKYELEHARFCYFMQQDGFLEKCAELGSKDKKSAEDLFWKMKQEISNNYNINLFYDTKYDLNQCIYPYHIIVEEGWNKHDEEFEKYIKQALGGKLSQIDWERLINKAITFLQEAIENAFEHAYDKENKHKYCGVYIRLEKSTYSIKNTNVSRNYNGKLSSADKKLGAIEYKKVIDKLTPYAVASEEYDEMLVIYVMDIGNGMLKAFGEIDKGRDRSIIENIFSNGLRSSKKGKNSKAGGLYMINGLFAEYKDCLAIKSDLNWNRFCCSLKRETFYPPSYISKEGKYAINLVHGFDIIGYIGIGGMGGDAEQNFVSFHDDIMQETSQAMDILLGTDIKSDFNREPYDITVLEQRFGLNKCIPNNGFQILVLPPCFLSRKEIFDITKKLKEDVKEDLIIGDIPDRELFKYIQYFQKNEIKLRKVILISQSLRCSVLIKYDKEIRYSRDETFRFMQGERSKTRVIYSFRDYCSFIKEYDSKLMWEIIAREQVNKGSKIYINGDVKWTKDKNLHGYLDFSQVSAISVCNDLCIRQLRRLQGIYPRPIYFRNADRFTDELCERANQEMDNMSRNQPVYISSVFVTGTSIEDTLLFQNNQCIYFFDHSFESGDRRTMFVWPDNEQWIHTNFPQTCTGYERIGKTPFIAYKGKCYYMERHYRDLGNVYEIGAPETYELLQEMDGISKDIVKMGHLEQENQHDFLSINIMALLRKAKIQGQTNPEYKANCWDYLLCEFLFSLTQRIQQKGELIQEYFSGEENYCKCKAKKAAEYARRKKFGRKAIKQVGIIVFINDFQTAFVAEELKREFSFNLQERIISLPPLLHHRTATSLLISPLLIEQLETTVKKYMDEDNSTVSVTIFSVMTLSTKQRKELKHILYQVGASEVSTLTLIDRQRFILGSKYSNKTFRAYMRMDLPSLENPNACLLCQGSRLLEKFQQNVNCSILVDRIACILREWHCAKPSDHTQGLGIDLHHIEFSEKLADEIKQMCNQYNIAAISISTNFGLALFAIESIVITLDTCFLSSCLSDGKLDKHTKMLMIITFLLYFNNYEITETIQTTLCSLLFCYLKEERRGSALSALAVLALITQKKEIRRMIYQKFCSEEFNKIKVKCLDYFLLCLYLYAEFETEFEIKYAFKVYLKPDEISIPDKIYGVSLLTNYKSLHQHSRTLIRIKERGKDFTFFDYVEAQNAVEYLEKSYKSLPNTIFHDSNQMDRILLTIHGSLQSLKDELICIINEKRYTSNPPDELVKKVETFLENAMDLNGLLLCDAYNDEDGEEHSCLNIKNRLEQLAVEVRNELCINKKDFCDFNVKVIQPKYLEKKLPNRWFYFYYDIMEEIRYLIGDMRHAGSTKLPNILENNIWEKGEQDNCYTGFVRVDFLDTMSSYMEISFINYIDEDESIERIRRVKNTKIGRPTMLDFPILNQRMNIMDNPSYEIVEANSEKNNFGKRIIKATLKIPYIDCKS